MIECAKIAAAVGGAGSVAAQYIPVWTQRRDLTIKGLALLRDPTNTYFVGKPLFALPSMQRLRSAPPKIIFPIALFSFFCSFLLLSFLLPAFILWFK